ncbi:hypothetical protein SAMN05444412_1313 [Rhodonellum ikkaensis]|uniref:Uncharacterized protein n=1 Tax=Rhodonellum ikkaensis TaxID=336829 RepID=A0A1H3U5T3_9BACT|nr:hypothetical protein SAMN05444412_1313 [Rhodonellum ikkaensis]
MWSCPIKKIKYYAIDCAIFSLNKLDFDLQNYQLTVYPKDQLL